MNPILYAKDTTDFSTMGIGVLSDTLSCVCTQDAGSYELEMEYPIGGIHFSDIQHSCYLKVIVPPMMKESPQLFYIVHISKPLNRRVTIVAHHISYKLSYIPIKPFTARTVSDLFNILKTNAVEEFPFTFQSDKGATIIDMKREYPVTAMELLGGSEGSLLDLTRGEFLWDNYNVTYKDDVGEDKGYELRYGVNVTDLKQEENISETITGLVPYWFNAGYNDEPSTLVTLDEYVVYTEGHENFPFKRSVPVDFSSYIEATYDDDHNLIPPTQEQLRTACQEYIQKNGFGVPKVSIDVSFENLARSSEFAFLKSLSMVKIYDTVTVIFPLLGITKKAKVIKTTYDVQQEKYISIEIGDKQESLSTRIADVPTMSEISEQTNGKIEQFSATIRQSIDTAVEETSKSILFGKGGYVVFGQDETTSPPHVDRILIMDKPDEQTATNIIQLNQNGIGFSTDGGQTYKQAWGINGKFNTEYISGETIESINLNSANIHGGYIGGVVIEAGDSMIYNYTNTNGVKGDVRVGSGTLTTHLTANGPITYYGLKFLSTNPGSGSGIKDWTGDGILFDSHNFVVSSKELAIASHHGYYHAGITTANMMDGGTSPHLIMLCQRDANASGTSSDLVGRIDCGPGYVGVALKNGNVNRSITMDYIIEVEGTSTGGRSGTYYIPAASSL